MATIINGTTGIDKIQDEVVITGTGGITVPSGTTAERPASPSTGMLRYNTDSNVLEQYTGTQWRDAYTPLPEITSVSPTDYDGETGTTITVNGNYFTSGATVQFKTTGGSYESGTTTFVNSNQLTAVTPNDYPVSGSPLSVKVIQTSGEDELADCITLGSSPTWVTASGTLVTVDEGDPVSTSVSASDDGSIESYAVTSGALPSGVTLNTSTGAITGTAPSVASNTTYTFGITATDNAGNTTGERSFSIDVVNTDYTVEYLTVAGGGSAGSYNGAGGGGGAGGYRASTLVVASGSSHTVTIGGGGSGNTGGTEGRGNNGTNSVFSTITSIGGGGGAMFSNVTGPTASSGGSGGGGSRGAPNNYNLGASGTAGQGNSGGNGYHAANVSSGGAGGGGASAAGSNASANNGGVGGAGSQWLNGSYYAGGGGGAVDNGSDKAGGIGGGGTANGGSGVANTGGGGTAPNGSGGSGVVIIRYLGSQKGSGGTISSSGGYTYHTFTSSGTYTA